MSKRDISIGSKTKAIIILLLNIALMGSSYAEDAKIRESYVIGKSGLNRITMLPHKIVSVVGDNSQYKLQSDKDGSSVYIMPIAKSNQIIELSIRSDVGEIRDLELKVVPGRGRTIKLKNTSFGANEFRDGVSYNERKEKTPLVSYEEFGKLNVGECYTLLPLASVRLSKIQVPQAKVPDKNSWFIEVDEDIQQILESEDEQTTENITSSSISTPLQDIEKEKQHELKQEEFTPEVN